MRMFLAEILTDYFADVGSISKNEAPLWLEKLCNEMSTTIDAVIVVYPEVAEYVLGEIEFEFLNEPELQEEPVNRPNVKKDLMLGALAGGALSMGIILIYALLRKTIRNEDDLKQTLNTPLLGMLPEVKEKALYFLSQDQELSLQKKGKKGPVIRKICIHYKIE